MSLEAPTLATVRDTVIDRLNGVLEQVPFGELVVIQFGNGAWDEPLSRVAAEYRGGSLSSMKTGRTVGRIAVPKGCGFEVSVIEAAYHDDLDVVGLMGHVLLDRCGEEFVGRYEHVGNDVAQPVMLKPAAEIFVGRKACREPLNSMKDQEKEHERAVFDFVRQVFVGITPGHVERTAVGSGWPGVSTIAERFFSPGI